MGTSEIVFYLLDTLWNVREFMEERVDSDVAPPFAKRMVPEHTLYLCYVSFCSILRSFRKWRILLLPRWNAMKTKKKPAASKKHAKRSVFRMPKKLRMLQKQR